MKTKNEIEKLFDKVDEEKETLLILHINEDQEFDCKFCGDRDAIAAGVATILYDGLRKDSPKDVERLARAVVDGVSYAVEKPSLSAVQIMMRLTDAISKSRGEIKKIFLDKDDENDAEDCENCENNRWCPLPDAVKYRKENHIPAPKKRKNGKRGGKKNENVN